MRLVITEAGLAIVVGSVTFIPNHITKAVFTGAVGAIALAYSAKEYGYHHSEKHLYLDRIQIREGQEQ
jgi:hypothetical protein